MNTQVYCATCKQWNIAQELQKMSYQAIKISNVHLDEHYCMKEESEN